MGTFSSLKKNRKFSEFSKIPGKIQENSGNQEDKSQKWVWATFLGMIFHLGPPFLYNFSGYDQTCVILLNQCNKRRRN